MKLTVNDFSSPGFDVQKPRIKGPKRNRIIEGVTFTDDFRKVGYTYQLNSGLIKVVNEMNDPLFSGKINNRNDFELAIRKTKIRKK